MAAPSTASQAFREGAQSGSKFVSTHSKSAMTSSLKGSVAHFGYAFYSQDMSEMQAASMSFQSAYGTTMTTVHGMDVTASAIANGTLNAASGTANAIYNAPEAAKATIHGIQAAPGKILEETKSAVYAVKTAPSKTFGAVKDSAAKNSRFVKQAPSKAVARAKQTGTAAVKNVRHAAGAPGRAVKTVRTSALNAQKYVRESGGIVKSGMKLGKKGAGAAGRASVSAARRAAYKIAEGLKRLVMRVVGAFAGVVAKFIFVPLIVVLGALLFIQSILPGWIYSIFFEETKHSRALAVLDAMDDYPWRQQTANCVEGFGGEGIRNMICNTGEADVHSQNQNANSQYSYSFGTGVNAATNYNYGNCTDFVFWRVNRDKMMRSGNAAQKKQVEEIRKDDYTPGQNDVDTSIWPYTHATLTPKGGNGGEWGNDGNMPGWVKVTSADAVKPGDVLSIKAGAPGTGNLGKKYGHVAYINGVDPNRKVVKTENYGNGKYYQKEWSFNDFNNYVSQGLWVVKHDPENEISGDVDADTATREGAQQYAAAKLADYGWDTPEQYSCLVDLWNRESGWRWDAENPSGAYGIPQSLPAEKMASAGSDYRTNGKTQINWGLGYIQGRYGSPCDAIKFHNRNNWY